MKTKKIKIGGRVFSLAFNVNVMEALDGMINDFNVGEITNYVKKPGGLKDVLLAMAAEGEAIEGRTLDVDRDWFGRHMGASAPALAKVQIAIYDTLREALFMQTETDDGGEVDVVLEEIKKKEGKDG